MANEQRYAGSRGVSDYFGAIRSDNRGWLGFVSIVAFAVGLWITKGFASFALAVGVSVLIVFPIGFLWWKRWGP